MIWPKISLSAGRKKKRYWKNSFIPVKRSWLPFMVVEGWVKPIWSAISIKSTWHLNLQVFMRPRYVISCKISALLCNRLWTAPFRQRHQATGYRLFSSWSAFCKPKLIRNLLCFFLMNSPGYTLLNQVFCLHLACGGIAGHRGSGYSK